MTLLLVTVLILNCHLEAKGRPAIFYKKKKVTQYSVSDIYLFSGIIIFIFIINESKYIKRNIILKSSSFLVSGLGFDIV
jgi:hypothetical protein